MMKMQVYSLVLLLLCPAISHAAEPAPRGVSPSVATQLRRVADAEAEKARRERALQLQKAAEATFEQLKNEREAFVAALEKQPEYEQMKREYDALAAQAGDPNTNRTARQREELRNRLSAFAKKYEPVQARAYRDARIDDRRVLSVLTANYKPLGATNFTKTGMAWFITVVIVPPRTTRVEPEPEPPQGPSCFGPPYSADTPDTSGIYPFVLLNSEADKTTGNFVLGTLCMFAAAANKVVEGGVAAGVSEYVTIPDGTHQVGVAATIHINDFSLMASSVGGVAWAGLELVVRVSGVSSGSAANVKSLGLAMAPIAGNFQFSEQDVQHQLSKDFSLSGGVRTIDVGASNFAGAIGMASAAASISGSVKEICAEIQD